MKNLIIYESKYGTTKESSEIVAKIIGYSKIIKTENFKADDKTFDNYIILSPIYNEAIHKKIRSFIVDNKEWLIKKDVYFCIVNLSGRAEFYLKEIKDILKDSLIIMQSINGNLIIERLDKEDFESIKKFFLIMNLPLEDNIKFDINEVVQVAINIKYKIEDRKESLSKEVVKKVIKKFISNHNTCVLCTSYENQPRATPIEYIYYNDTFYFISEGGIKFANILRNNKVSIGIFDNYKDMKKIGGIQITGEATNIEYLSDEYLKVMKLRNISMNTIKKLDIILNVFRVSVEKFELLNTEFKKYNGDVRQILNMISDNK